MLEPLTALTALAMSGCTAADLPRHLSCQSRLSQLRSLTVRSANMQVTRQGKSSFCHDSQPAHSLYPGGRPGSSCMPFLGFGIDPLWL